MPKALVVGFLLLAAASCEARTLYVYSNGNDAANGLSPQTAWHTLARLGRDLLRSGDEVVLEGGASFEGSVVLNSDDQIGSVVIRSSGGTATIVCSKGAAIAVHRGEVTLENLNLRSEATAPEPKNIGVHLDATGDKTLRHVQIKNVGVSGFGGDGISIDAKAHGFEDVTISHVVVDHCFGTGLSSDDGVAYKGLGYAHHNFHVTDSEFTRNGSDSGIVLSGVDGALIEYCRAADNDRGNGGLGMWAWSARRVTFRYCISSGTRSRQSDGGGFDLDGGCEDCVIEHCLSFDNDGCGYMHCDYPDAPPTRRNVIRDSVSIDDGARKSKPQSAGFGFVTWGSGLDDCAIERNWAFVSRDFPTKVDGGALFVAFVPDLKTNGNRAHVRGCVFRNNIVDAEVGAAVGSNLPGTAPSNVRFESDRYLEPSFLAVDNGTRYTTLSAWQGVKGHDKDGVKALPSLWGKLAGYRSVTPRQLPGFLAQLR